MVIRRKVNGKYEVLGGKGWMPDAPCFHFTFPKVIELALIGEYITCWADGRQFRMGFVPPNGWWYGRITPKITQRD